MTAGAENAVCEFYGCVAEIDDGAVLFGFDPEPLAVVVGEVQVAEDVVGGAVDLEPT